MLTTSLYQVSALLAPLHNRTNRQAETHLFDCEPAAQQARFLLAVDFAAEQQLIPELLDQFDLMTEENAHDEKKQYQALCAIAPELYDDVVETITASLEADEVTQCFIRIEKINLADMISASQNNLRYMQEQAKLPIVTNTEQHVAYLQDKISDAKRQLQANPNMSSDALFDCCANAFKTLSDLL